MRNFFLIPMCLLSLFIFAACGIENGSEPSSESGGTTESIATDGGATESVTEKTQPEPKPEPQPQFALKVVLIGDGFCSTSAGGTLVDGGLSPEIEIGGGKTKVTHSATASHLTSGDLQIQLDCSSGKLEYEVQVDPVLLIINVSFTKGQARAKNSQSTLKGNTSGYIDLQIAHK